MNAKEKAKEQKKEKQMWKRKEKTVDVFWAPILMVPVLIEDDACSSWILVEAEEETMKQKMKKKKKK